MPTLIHISALSLGLLVLPGSSSGYFNAACAGERCHSDEPDDLVAMLQLPIEEGHFKRSRESHSAASKVHVSSDHAKLLLVFSSLLEAKAAEQEALHVRTDDAEQKTRQARPNITLVMLVSILLGVASLLFYFVGFTLTSKCKHADKYERSVNLIACFAGLIIAFCSFGIVQEYIMTQDYNGEMFPSVPFLILSNRVIIVCVAAVMMTVRGETLLVKPFLCTIFPGASNMISSWCQYECLHYVSFPTQLVFKSASIVPTMLMNMLVNRVCAPLWDYVQAVIVASCVIGFSLITDKSSAHAGASNTVRGLIMLSAFILGEALTSTGEKKIYETWKEAPTQFTSIQMMLSMGIVGLMYSGVCTAFTDGGYPVLFAFVSKHPECLMHMLALSLCSMSGQYLIYYIVQRHGPVVVSFFMTVRRVLSMLLAAYLYGDNIPPLAWLMAGGCFGVLLAKPVKRYLSKTGEAKQLERL